MVPESPITPDFIADPANRAAMRERARNTANVNPHPTTMLPVKSQAVEGPTATPGVQNLEEADQAVVDPSPELNGAVSSGPETAEHADDPAPDGGARRVTGDQGTGGTGGPGETGDGSHGHGAG